jgi:hypothetical protein
MADIVTSQASYERIIINKESLRNISNAVSESIERRLTLPECRDLLEFCRKFKVGNWKGKSADEVQHNLSKLYVQYRFTEKGRINNTQTDDIVDIHEILKGHIGTSDQEPDYETVNNVDVDGRPVDLRMQDLENAGLQSIVAAPQQQLGIPQQQGQNNIGSSTLGSIDNIRNIDKLMTLDRVNNIVSFLGKSDDVSIQTMLNPQAAWKYNYIILDSRHRDQSVDGITKFKWTFLSGSTSNSEGVVNSLGDVKQLIAISCPNIRIPYSNSNDIVLTNSYRRVTMLIEEFNSQSIIAQEGRRYHFMFEAALDNNMLDLRASPNEEATFEFAKPITQLDTFTISFANPLEIINFDKDRLIMNVNYTNPARFIASEAHNLQTGDQIYINGFTSNDPITDKGIIDYTNRINGFNIIVIDANTFDAYLGDQGLDLTQVTDPINPYNIPIYFGSKRIFIPLKLKYIAPKSSTTDTN